MSHANKGTDAYGRLCARSRVLSLWGGIAALCDWDQQTKMPPAAAAHRSEQSALLAETMHRLGTDESVGHDIDEALASGRFDVPASPEAANLREWKRRFDRASRIPTDMAADMARTASASRAAWEDALRDEDFQGFAPHLKKMLDFKRREAELVGYESEPYDALLDYYEPGERAAVLLPVFSELLGALPPLIDQAVARQDERLEPVAHVPFDIPAQQAFCTRVAKAMGYDFDRGRLDETTHPFCTELGPRDVRITTHSTVDDWLGGLSGVMHETGHALYSLGLPEEHHGQPAGMALSLGVHESQSRLWENHVGRSDEFWEFALPLAKQCCPGLEGLEPSQAARATRLVGRSLRRIGADEVSYNLHVAIRFELEVAMLRGDLDVDGLPGAWNERYEKLLGIVPPSPSLGCLQDVHWSHGLFGYFPTYTLGNLYAAMLYARLLTERPDCGQAMRRGDFSPVLGFLRERVHQAGGRLWARELMEKACHEPLSAGPFLAHLRSRYLGD